MNAIEMISQDLFDKVRSRFSNLEMGDEDGTVTSDPVQARFFDFDFTIESNNLGRVSISLNERGALKIFYGQGILESSDNIIQDIWFKFLREMRNFAKRRLMRFDTRDITKSNLDKTDFKYLATTGSKEESMAESKMFGSAKSSYLPLERTRLVIRHNKVVDEEQRGSRSRNINAIFIENAEGERFKYPYPHLAGAKAMQRHVANGGRPYDECGSAIVSMSEQIAQLSAFKRHIGRHDSMQTEANDIMERACSKLEGLRGQLANMSKQGHYAAWKEAFSPVDNNQMALDQATMEDYKNKFTVNTFAEDLTQYFPLLHSIMQETGEVDLAAYVGEDRAEECTVCHKSPCECDDVKKESIDAFESWANAIIEGRMTPDVIASLKALLDAGLTLDVDGTNAIEALQGIGIDDTDLFTALEHVAKLNPETDPTLIIGAWLEKYDPAAAKELDLASPAEPSAAAEPVPAEEPAEEPAMPAEEGMEDEYEEDKQPTSRDVAEMVKSFYDRATGKFPMGETGVIVKVKKEYGDRAAALAERLIQHLAGHHQSHDTMTMDPHDSISPIHGDESANNAFEDIMRLAGLKKIG